MSSKNNPKSNKPRPWLMVAAATAAVLLVLGGMFMLLRNTPPAAEAPAAGSAPKAVVEQIELDAGYQIFSTPVQHVFKISNTGQGPLTILGEPKVELIEGC